ncbi:MAG: hypothetical protein UZ16_OP3001000766 [Candidatus Hinthialibacteria bacterium OLB16]|nr:MAG: hypothetical protein UZ16_OP3001000766 [Candidatus Hinthialibacteria bacterium OLB16]
MWLWPLVSVGRTHHLAGARFDIVMPLGRPFDAISPVQSGIEPLRRVGSCHLGCERITHFIEIGARIFLAAEISVFPAPIGPAASQAVKYIPAITLSAVTFLRGEFFEGFFIRHPPLQPLRDPCLLNVAQPGGNSGFAAVFLGQDICRHLGPFLRHLDVRRFENHRSICVRDSRYAWPELERIVWIRSRLCESSFDFHLSAPSPRHPRCDERSLTEYRRASAFDFMSTRFHSSVTDFYTVCSPSILTRRQKFSGFSPRTFPDKPCVSLRILRQSRTRYQRHLVVRSAL